MIYSKRRKNLGGGRKKRSNRKSYGFNRIHRFRNGRVMQGGDEWKMDQSYVIIKEKLVEHINKYSKDVANKIYNLFDTCHKIYNLDNCYIYNSNYKYFVRLIEAYFKYDRNAEEALHHINPEYQVDSGTAAFNEAFSDNDTWFINFQTDLKSLEKIENIHEPEYFKEYTALAKTETANKVDDKKTISAGMEIAVRPYESKPVPVITTYYTFKKEYDSLIERDTNYNNVPESEFTKLFEKYPEEYKQYLNEQAQAQAQAQVDGQKATGLPVTQYVPKSNDSGRLVNYDLLL
jgi:hypothetical protein